MCGRLRVGKENLHVAGLVGAAMCSASHDGFSVKGREGQENVIQGGALIPAGFPAKPHIRWELIPTTVPHSGRESSKRTAPLCVDGAAAPRRTTATFPRITGCLALAAQAGLETDQVAGFKTAPSGTTPSVTNRHSAISSFLARATTMTLRTRRPVDPTRSRNQQT
jgi:hypothetical protein